MQRRKQSEVQLVRLRDGGPEYLGSEEVGWGPEWRVEPDRWVPGVPGREWGLC